MFDDVDTRNTRKMTIDQLVESADGPSGQKVQAEMNRRFIEALNASKELTEKYSKRIEYLTWVLVVLTIILVIIGVLPFFLKFITIMLYTLFSVIIFLLLGIISLITQESLDRRYPGTDNSAIKLFFIYLVVALIVGGIFYFVLGYFGIV